MLRAAPAFDELMSSAPDVAACFNASGFLMLLIDISYHWRATFRISSLLPVITTTTHPASLALGALFFFFFSPD